jgi:prepilin-type processing-associated H-X9-DG protein
MGALRTVARRVGGAFTQIELAVVFALVVVMVAVMLPAVQKVRESAERSQCVHHLRQLGMAMQQYYTDNLSFPQASYNPWNYPPGVKFQPSWWVYLLPYTGQNSLAREIGLVASRADLDAAVTRGVLPAILPYQRCPSDPFRPSDSIYVNYQVSMGPQCATPFCAGPIDYQVYCHPYESGIGDWGWRVTFFGPGQANPFGDYGRDWSFGPLPKSQTRGMFANYGFGMANTTYPNPATQYTSQGGLQFNDVTDGLANTIMLGEILPAQFETFGGYPAGWADPLNLEAGVTTVPLNYQITVDRNTIPLPPDPGVQYPSACPLTPGPSERNVWNWGTTWGFKSKHVGGANFAFGDGSVRFLSETIDARTYNLLGCRNDGQGVSVP